MARVAPFRGLRYNTPKAGPLNLLIPPPGDVVSPRERERLLKLHDHNFIHLILTQTCDRERFREAAQKLEDWWRQGVLTREAEPAMYLYQMTFSPPGRAARLTRTGFICLLRLQDYRTGMIRPHERTLPTVREERLASICSCQANLSTIFTIYDDPKRKVIRVLEEAAPARPEVEFEDLGGIRHRLWLITDPKVHRAAARLLQDRPFYIADGHHRYETGLAHRNLMRQEHPRADQRSSFNYTLAYATAVQDRGLTLRPTHRLIRDLPGFEAGSFLAAAAEFFEVRETGLSPRSEPDRRKFEALLAEDGAGRTTLGFLTGPSGRLGLLKLKPGLAAGPEIPPPLRDLDVVVLDELILRRCLGLDPEDSAGESAIDYEADFDAAVRRIEAGEAKLGFLLNPTRVAQVKAVADAGLFMPPKSTHFFPKVVSGLVINPIVSGETVVDPLEGD